MQYDLDTLALFVVFIVGVLIGNVGGDTQTFKDCATKGQAKMLGGGVVVCTVKKEQS